MTSNYKYYERLIYRVNSTNGILDMPILCPNTNNGCSSLNIKKNGHDMSTKSLSQKYFCKDCGRSFYAHTSYFHNEISSLINKFIIKLCNGGRLDLTGLSFILKCGNSSISLLMKKVMTSIYNSARIKMAWASKFGSKLIFVDETFIKINRRVYYLVLVVDDAGNVLAWELLHKRSSGNILRVINMAISKLSSTPEIIISDDFSTYKKVVKLLGFDIIHIRHIHKPPYGRIVIDIIKHVAGRIVISHVATLNDIFLNKNVFITRETESIEVKHEKGKRGRKKGSKNRPKRKRRDKDPGQKKPNKKRGPKNYFKKGKTRVYQYLPETNSVVPIGNDDHFIAEKLSVISGYFKGKHITSNKVEQKFSILKKMVNFRGKRSVSAWNLVLYFHFTIRQFPDLVEDVVDEMKICPIIARRSENLFWKLLKSGEKLKSETIYIKNSK